MKATERVKTFVEHQPALRVISGVLTRTKELNGSYAASALTLIAFVSLFPLLLLIISIAGIITGSNPHVTDELIKNLGLTGQSAETMRTTMDTAADAGKTGSIIALVGMAWSGLALVGALRYVVNLPYDHSVKGLKARLLGVPWLLGALVVFLASFAISAVLNWLPGWTAPIAILVSLGVDFLLFGWTYWFLDVRRPDLKLLLPGTIVASLGFEALKAIGTIVVPRLVANSSSTYGSIGTVFAILAWLLIFGRLIVYSVVLNAVWADHLADRPLTDAEAEELSEGDSADEDAESAPAEATQHAE